MISLVLAASEPSKVPVYIFGGAVAVWAVVLAGLGLSRPEFPYSLRGQRGVIAISFLLIVCAIAAAVLTDP
jgi:hypothetical protein